ncbi:MAG TPA: class I SAM-dependent methyltransferase [Roseiflexaceae bacterium]|nr:class I SAM-dependent methyltransferase [Roseiflexaceae bacterium]
MQQITYKFRNVLWYLRRPNFYPEFLQAARWQLFHASTAKTEQEAQSWAAERAISTPEAIANITGQPNPVPVRLAFADLFAVADRLARAAEDKLNRTPPFVPAGAANVDLLYWLAEHVQARHIVETGVAYGWSSLAFLLSLKHRNNSLLISSDMPFPGKDDDYVGCVVPEELRSHWQLIARPDREAVPKALEQLRSIDICHYDSDKSYRGRMWAYALLWKALRAGGCFISDDIGDNFAFRDFFDDLGVDYTIVHTMGRKKLKHVGIAIKPNRSRTE